MPRTIALRFDDGDLVRDKVTGFEGVVTGFTTYITGCDQYLVNPPAKDGTYPEGKWLDDVRLDLVEAAKVTLGVPSKTYRLKGAAPEGAPRR